MFYFRTSEGGTTLWTKQGRRPSLQSWKYILLKYQKTLNRSTADKKSTSDYLRVNVPK